MPALLHHEPAYYEEMLQKLDSFVESDPQTINIGLSACGAYVCLNWTNTGVIGKYDYVALYNQNPQQVGPKGYVNSDWQWAVDASPYQTSAKADGKTLYWIAYCGWDYSQKQYAFIRIAGPCTVPPGNWTPSAKEEALAARQG